MKTLALALLIAFPGAFATADETAPAKSPGDAKTRELVAAAKAAKAKRQKSTSRVLTNKDVAKSKGKLVETTNELEPIEPAPRVGMVEQHEAAKKARAQHDARVVAAEQSVLLLEKELAALEQRYYEENDLTRRDREIARRFGETRAALDVARAELAALLAAVAERNPVIIRNEP